MQEKYWVNWYLLPAQVYIVKVSFMMSKQWLNYYAATQPSKLLNLQEIKGNITPL